MPPGPIALTAKFNTLLSGTKWARLRFWLHLFLIFDFALITIECGLDIEDPNPPSPPVWVQKSLPAEWPERGIDAHESKGTYLEWAINPDDHIIACELYRASFLIGTDTLSEFNLLARVEGGSELGFMEYIDTDIIREGEYLYTIRAEDVSENYSSFSDSIRYGRLRAINIDLMVPNGISEQLPQTRELSWTYPYSIEMETYCITILDQSDQLTARVVFMPKNYTGESESWNIPLDVMLVPGARYKWRIDTGANYIDERETFGSESSWASFIYNTE